MIGIATVVGGSLAGLMHAITLKKIGYQVHVLERNETAALESQAAGIRAGPEVHDFLTQYTRSPLDYAITTHKVELMDSEGQVVQEVPSSQPLRLTTWKIVYDMLKHALLDNTDGHQVATYQTRHVVQEVEQAGEKMEVTVMNLETGSFMSMISDLVIASDGAHSAIRKKLCPEVTPQYVGYVTWRGRVPETAVSASTREVLKDRCVILRVDGGYQISYYVPRDNDPNSEQRDFVWIWYDTVPSASPEFVETFTDVDGVLRSTTVPRGKMSSKVWQRLLDRKREVKNPYFVELMESIEEPFVSAIREFSGKKALFYDKKLLLVGDAFTLCRPHGGGSTSEAAFQANTLLQALQGDITLDQWEATCLVSAEKAARFSLAMADFFWNGKASQ